MKKKSEEKGALYASVAADYSTVYQTVCDKEVKNTSSAAHPKRVTHISLAYITKAHPVSYT